MLFTRSRAYKARDEVGQNAVEESKVDQNICFLKLCLETPVRKVLRAEEAEPARTTFPAQGYKEICTATRKKVAS